MLTFGAVPIGDPPPERILDAHPDERLAKLAELEWEAPWAWADAMESLDANRAAADLYAELVRRSVRDADVAERLVPRYPLGCKRLIHRHRLLRDLQPRQRHPGRPFHATHSAA